MSPDKINRMINQIATFFETQPDTDKPARVAAHLKEFWEPRMLEQLGVHLDQGGEGLSPLAREGCNLVLQRTS